MKKEVHKKVMKDGDGRYWLNLGSGWLYLGEKRREARHTMAYLKKHKLIKED